MSVVRMALFALALLAGALSAGFFYTFSILVMPALATADAGTAIVAMQKINLSVRTAFFAFAFFGAPALALLAAAAAGLAGHRRAAWLALVAGLLHDARWTPWNHVRAVGAAVSFLFLLAAFASDVGAGRARR